MNQLPLLPHDFYRVETEKISYRVAATRCNRVAAMGEAGAHQFYNHDLNPCIYLDIKTVIGLDVCEYPDSGKINISPFNEIFVKDLQVDYFYREENVSSKWIDFNNDSKSNE